MHYQTFCRKLGQAAYTFTSVLHRLTGSAFAEQPLMFPWLVTGRMTLCGSGPVRVTAPGSVTFQNLLTRPDPTREIDNTPPDPNPTRPDPTREFDNTPPDPNPTRPTRF